MDNITDMLRTPTGCVSPSKWELKAADEIDRLRTKLRKVAAWLDRLANAAERDAEGTRFETIREACQADARNYRATLNDILTVLPPILEPSQNKRVARQRKQRSR